MGSPGFCGTKKPPEEIICTECGEVYPPDTDYAFCPNCGNPLLQPSDSPKPASSSSKSPEPKTVSDPAPELTQKPTPETSDDEAIPEELVGDWQGVGKPKNGGPSIDLTIHVEEDGTGKYTFDQAGYHESYPFTISRDGKRFSVDVPATSQLGSVDGTWEVEDDVLKLDITSTFTSGGSYSYNAECKRIVAEDKGNSAAEGNQAGFEEEYSWLSYHLTVNSKEIVPGTELDKSPFSTIKDKMFAKIRLMGKDEEILTTDLQDDSKMGQFVLTNKEGKELPLYSVSMWGITFDADLGFSTKETQEGFDLIFLVGDSDRIEDLTLTVKDQ